MMSLPPWDTDPMYVAGDELEPAPAPRTKPGIPYTILALVVLSLAILAVIALIVFVAWKAPTPREGSDPRSHQGLALRGAPADREEVEGPGSVQLRSRSEGSELWATRGVAAVGAPLPAEEQIGSVIEGGWISQANRSHGPRYLAIRGDRGTWVRICGPAACEDMASTDYGPSSRITPTRIADVALVVWRRICGLPDGRGLCEGSIEYIERPALPATDTSS